MCLYFPAMCSLVPFNVLQPTVVFGEAHRFDYVLPACGVIVAGRACDADRMDSVRYYYYYFFLFFFPL